MSGSGFAPVFAVLVVLALAAGLRTYEPPVVKDDAYITFRYARNIYQGEGFVFNPGERVLGTTTPLYTLTLAGFGKMGLDIVVLSRTINVLASVLCSLVVYLILRAHGERWAALLAALILGISPPYLFGASSGMEIDLYALFMLLTGYFYLRGMHTWAGLFGGLVVFTRPDGLIMTAILLVFHLATNAFRLTKAEWRGVVVFIGVLLPWVVFATWYFGSPLPGSITAKAVAYRVAMAENVTVFFQTFLAPSPYGMALATGFLLGVLTIALGRSKLSLLPVWFVGHSLVLVLTGTSLRSGWYLPPLWPPFVATASVGIGFLFAQLSRNPGSILAAKRKLLVGSDSGRQLVRRVVTAVMVASFLFLSVKTVQSRISVAQPQFAGGEPVEKTVGVWLGQNTAPGATVALESIGIVGWFSERRILDLGGLVSPQAASINREKGGLDPFKVLFRYQPDYYVMWNERWEKDLLFARPGQQEWFEGNYRDIAHFGSGDATWVVYARADQAGRHSDLR